MTTKATPFCHCDGTTMTTRDSATPMIRLARSAPTRLPMPPRMVMAKALMVRGNPTAGYTLKSGAMRAPPMPAKEHEERGQEERGDRADEHPLVAHPREADLEDAPDEGRNLPIVAAADGEQARLHEGGEPERQHQVERAGGTAPEPPLERRDEQRVHTEPQQKGPGPARHRAHDGRKMEKHHGGEEHVAPHREELAVGDVDHVQHAEDQGDPHRKERVEPTEHDALNQKLKQRFQPCRPPRR